MAGEHDKAAPPPADLFDALTKPWMALAESVWGNALGAVVESSEAQRLAGAQQRTALRALALARTQAARQAEFLDLPTRADIDALVNDIAELRAEIAELRRDLAARPRRTRAKS